MMSLVTLPVYAKITPLPSLKNKQQSMFTKKDIEILKGMFLENNAILRLEIRDEMHALITATENRLRKDINQVREDVVELIDSTILPQISDLQHDVGRIKRHIGLV